MSKNSKITNIRERLLFSQDRCFCCGKKFWSGNIITLEHVIPTAIFKWVAEDIVKKDSTTTAKSIIRLSDDKRNLRLSHSVCNAGKSNWYSCNLDIYYKKYGVPLLGKEFNKFFEEVLPYIEKYDNLLGEVLVMQKCCIICGEHLSRDNIVLRRNNLVGGRTIENAVCLCTDSKCHSDYNRTVKNTTATVL